MQENTETETKTKTKTSCFDLSVAKRIKSMRVSAGLTQTDVASKLDVSAQQVQKYESGANKLSASNMYRLSELFCVDINHFFSEVELASNENEYSEQEIYSLFKKIKNKKIRKDIVNLLTNFIEIDLSKK